MCCEECSHYEKCMERELLKEDCCSKCPEYYDCTGMYESNNEEDDSLR